MELTLFVDHQCNLRCTYCYNGDKFNRRMTLDTAKRAIEMALREPGPHVDISLFGGEPLIDMKLVEAIMQEAERAVEKLRPRPTLRFVINSNGTLIDDEVIKAFGAPRKSAFFVSIDGGREVHDRCRVYASGRGSFDDVVAGIERLDKAGIQHHLVAVFNTVTCAHLGDTLEAISSIGSPAKINLAADFRDDWTEETIEVLRQGLHKAGDVWMQMFRQGRQLAIEPLHAKILTHLKGGIPCPSRCQLAGNEFTVTPTGRIYPCAQMVGEDTGDGFVVGHIDTGMDTAKLAQMQTAKDRVEDTCAPCAIRDRCQSHCGCRHVALTGKLGEITAVLCEIESAFIDEADRVAETLYEEQCEAFIDYYYKKNWVASRGGVLTQLRRSRDD